MKRKCRKRDYKKQRMDEDYRNYTLDWKEEGICFLECVFLMLLLSYFFYRSYYPIISIFIVYPVYRKYRRKKMAEKRRKIITFQFREMLSSLSGTVTAGYSLENAVKEVCGDMKDLYGKNSFIVKELAVIEKGINNNQPVEQLFLYFGMRSGVEEIDQFAAVLAIGKHYGGAINEVMEDAIDTIDEKIAVKQEIDTMLQAKEYELRVMEIIPFAIILYIELTSRNYFKDLYHSLAGILIMTICLLVYLLAVYLAEKIIRIPI